MLQIFYLPFGRVVEIYFFFFYYSSMMKSKILFWFLAVFFGGGMLLPGVVVSNVSELVTAIDNANNGGDKEIVLQNGTYTLSDMLPVWVDGVTVRSQSGNRDSVIIKGQGMYGSVTHIFNVAGSNFTAKNMTIGWVANHAIQIWGNNNSSNNLISNLRIVDTYEQMIKCSYESGNSNSSENCIVEKCLFEYSAGVGPQWYIGGVDAHQAKNWIVRNNVFKYISSPSADVAEHAVHFWSDSSGTLVENNKIIDCDRGIGFGLGSRGHSGGIIRNNMIYHSTTDYGFADVAIGLENASNAKVYNNTVYLANNYSNAIEYRFSGTTGCTITNNLCNKAITSRDGGSATLSSNITNASSSWFTSVATGDLHLAYEVPAVVDQGVAVSGLTGDFDGDSRPQGSGIDIGADEYVSGGGGGGGGGGGTKTATIDLNRQNLNFGAVISQTVTGTQTIWLKNTGTGTMEWSVSSDSSWLSCAPSSGTDTGTLKVSVSASGLSTGSYDGTLSVSSDDATNSPQTIDVSLNVMEASQAEGPFGSFDSPQDGETVRSSIAVTGWALDDVEVQSVKIYNGSNFIGNAVFVEGSRPDVAQLMDTYPNNYKAGWGYMLLTNFLPGGGNGTYTLYAKATDSSGNVVTLGSKTITCDNDNAVKPFGAIDTPTQGGTASGDRFVVFGWVLTPQPNEIPTDGSTISVWVDGVNLGQPTYNLYRSDIATLFPGYANSQGAVGYFYLDTTAYENGVHTIQWKATDSAGNKDGIGSRYFIIDNDDNNDR